MRKDLAGKISDSELEVMKLLWRAEASLSITEIRENLQQTKGWEPATIKTLVSRLVSKGAVRQEKRNVYYYSPLVSEEEYASWAFLQRHLREMFFHDRLIPFYDSQDC